MRIICWFFGHKWYRTFKPASKDRFLLPAYEWPEGRACERCHLVEWNKRSCAMTSTPDPSLEDKNDMES